MPYDMEPANPGEPPVRQTAGGDLLRRTMNAAPRESEVDQATVPGAMNINRDLAPGAQTSTCGRDAAQGSPDRYRYSISTAGLNQATGQLRGLQLDQAGGQVYGYS